MDKVLLLSDTHGNHKLLEEVLKANQDCKYLIHLGDEPDDLEYHPELIYGKQIYSVYGLYHPKWTPENACISFDIKNQKFVIAHTPADIKLEKQECIYCFGHTHNRHFERDGNNLFINPGHLKNKNDRGQAAGYAVIELGEELKVTFKNYKHKLVE